jgi:CDP-diacylglycerol--serine O-phosphatidyltransferase
MVAVYTVIIGLLMVSNLPTFSGKNIGKRISRQWVLPLMIAAVLAVALLFSFPWTVLSLTAAGYLATLPFSITAWNRQIAATD